MNVCVYLLPIPYTLYFFYNCNTARDISTNFAILPCDHINKFQDLFISNSGLCFNFEYIETCSIKETIKELDDYDFIKDIKKQCHLETDVDDAVTEYTLFLQV